MRHRASTHLSPGRSRFLTKSNMAARKASVLLNCLSCSRQNNKLLGVVTRSLSHSRARIVTPSLSLTPSCSMVPRSMCSSLATLDISDKDEKIEIPKAADSHLTESVFDNELVNKFVNCMMWDGKKSLSQNIFKMTMEEIKKEQLQKQRESSKPDLVETESTRDFCYCC
ncbi:ribosomal protein S7 [Desmophyllum pertusum]|uniref:Ribosomal protein S7 n=1 Tax=Desmophyllum pertusum TaxID=174260 RepID=A0A9W9ZMF9_9CNID|nr:ribosomal protein S7 [Desmophyllum pertusum]